VDIADERAEPAAAPDEDEYASEGGTPPARSTSRLPIALAVIFGLLAVAMLVFMTQLREQRNDARDALSGLEGDRAEVASVAGQFGEAILSYDYQDIDGSQQRVLELSTGQFQREYETGFEGFAELIEQTEAQSVATVTGVFVGDVSGERAEAIAVVDASVTGTGGTREVADSYIRLDLVKVGDTWKVDGVTSLNFASGGGDAGVPGASTTTTAPDSSE
jgi:Mce-associated membrane protein